MFNLIKVDTQRVLRDKLFLVMGILAVVFAVAMPLLYWGISLLMEEAFAEMMLGDLFSAKSHFFSAFVLSDNLGLILPVLLAIILCKDFSQGTVRNKIISGHSRASIFLSMYTVCTLVLFGMMLLHALMTLGISLIFFDYQSAPFTSADFTYLLQSLLLELLCYLFVGAIVSYLCAVMKNAGMAVVLYVAVMFGCTLISGILQAGVMALSMDPAKESVVKLLETLQNLNIFSYSANIGQGTAYTNQELLYYLLTPVVGTTAVLTLGILKFNRKDLK